MHTVTFYSFKGGVGRTMALVNVGLELVRRGRRVLLVDFDLEAPGLSTYPDLQGPQDANGLVEYIEAYRQTGAVPDVREFVYQVDVAELLSKRPKRIHTPESAGALWVMPAGAARPDYGSRLATINWQELYDRQNGFMLFEDTKQQWEDSFRPDYVLVDSRTGHTDVGGICTRQLADAVVMVFFPNEQNRLGLQLVANDIRNEVRETRRDIALHLVMSNVPHLDDEEMILRRHKYQFLETLGGRELTTIYRYESLMHLDQRAFVLDRPRSRLAKQYRKLVHRLVLGNPLDRGGAMLRLGGFRQTLDGLSKERARGVVTHLARAEMDVATEVVRRDWEVNGRAIAEQVQAIVDNFADDRVILLEAAKVFTELSDVASASAVLDRVIAIADSAEARLMRSRARFQLRNTKGAIEDLLAVIEASESDESTVVGAVLDLGRLQRARVRDPEVMAVIDRLSPGGKLRVVDLVASEHDGFEAAINLMRSALSVLPRPKYDPTLYHRQLAVYHLYRHEWDMAEEAVAGSYEYSVRRYEILTMFLRGMAAWGKAGEFPSDLAERLVSLMHAQSATNSYPSDCQALAIAYWRVGDLEKARILLRRSVGLMDRLAGPTLSFWRCRSVTADEFRSDCDGLKTMIESGSGRPAVFDASTK
ncbi:MAG: AAA family ATPase [Planctomycetes bacterium]|nr:AAA family ATPase [Planctomycetota bacterium]